MSTTNSGPGRTFGLAYMFASATLFVPGAEAKPPDEALCFWAYNDRSAQTQATGADDHGNVIGFYFKADAPAVGFIHDVDGNFSDLVSTAPGGKHSTYPVAINGGRTLIGTSGSESWPHDMQVRSIA